MLLFTPMPDQPADEGTKPSAPLSEAEATAEAKRIYWEFQTSRDRNRMKMARDDYRRTFRRSYNDKSIDYDFQACIEDYYLFRPGPVAAEVKLPAPIALALYLRSVARPGSPPKSLAQHLQDRAQMDAVWLRKARWKKMGHYPTTMAKIWASSIGVSRIATADEAQDAAVKHIFRHWLYRGKRPENLLSEQQMSERLTKHKEYGLTPPRSDR